MSDDFQQGPFLKGGISPFESEEPTRWAVGGASSGEQASGPRLPRTAFAWQSP